jgi:UDP-N-acetyl-D-glucosamine dehydrogenase
MPVETSSDPAAAAPVLDRLAGRTAVVGVIGLGYVGLPLAIAAARAGHGVIGFDVDEAKIVQLAAGASYIESVTADAIRVETAAGRFSATTDFKSLALCDVIVICVPTPLTRQREPDLSFVERTAETVAEHRRGGATIILESTTWPWTTETVVKNILEARGHRSGIDFFLGFSPEREDPGNARFRTATIPKVVSGDGPEALAIVSAFYASVVEKVVPVSSPRTAEAVKITENIFRAVNIALVNELKVIYDAMDIDIWEVIDAAATKPFGFMPFYPGPGLGGHCIPIDPFYLTWKAREYDVATRFIELAGEINVAMPRYVVSRLERELDRVRTRSLGAATVLILGLAYKKNVSDIRESPAFAIMHLLDARGTRFDYHDPHVAEIPPTREHGVYRGRRSVAVTAETLAAYDAVVLVTDHDAIDYDLVAAGAPLVIDTRNAFGRRNIVAAHVVKA